jgi:hypothetical protein
MNKHEISLPRMACAKVCPLGLKRFHATCIFCHYRRAYKKQLNPKNYVHPHFRRSTNPRRWTTLYLAVDNERRFKAAKELLLRKLMVIAEMLSN